MATINLDKMLKFLKEQDAKTKAEAIRMSADPHVRGVPSRFIDPKTGTARPGTVAPAPAGADPFVKTKHGFFARNYGPPAGTQGQGGVSMGATYPRRVTGYPRHAGGALPPRYPTNYPPHASGALPRRAELPGTIAGTTRVPQVPRVVGGGSRVSDPMNTRPGTFMGSLHHPPSIAGMRDRTQVIPDRNILPRQPNQRVPSLQQPQFAGRHPPVMRWDAGQMRLPNQRVPSKAQVTVTQEEGKPTKTVTKYDEERDHTLIGQALRRHQEIMESRRQDSARSAGVSMQGIPRTGYPDETIEVSPGDVQIIPRVRPQDVQVIPRGTSYPGGSYGSSLPPMPPTPTGDTSKTLTREWNPELESKVRAYLAGKKSIGESLSDAGLGRSAAMRQAYESRPRYGLQSQRGWDRQAPFPNPYYNFYGMLGENEY